MKEKEIIDVKENKLKADDFKLERYKFILQQLNSLNEGTHKYIALYQTLVTAIIGAGFAIYATWQGEKLSSETARLGIKAFLWLFTILTLFVILSMIMNAISWFDYRKEEVKLLSDEVGKDFRKAPTFKNIWRWSETWFVIFLIAMIILIWTFVQNWIIPSII